MIWLIWSTVHTSVSPRMETGLIEILSVCVKMRQLVSEKAAQRNGCSVMTTAAVYSSESSWLWVTDVQEMPSSFPTTGFQGRQDRRGGILCQSLKT